MRRKITKVQTESISIGIPPLESSALIYIAEDQHFFADNGLNVTIRVYEPAIAGVDGMLNVLLTWQEHPSMQSL